MPGSGPRRPGPFTATTAARRSGSPRATRFPNAHHAVAAAMAGAPTSPAARDDPSDPLRTMSPWPTLLAMRNRVEADKPTTGSGQSSGEPDAGQDPGRAALAIASDPVAGSRSERRSF